MKNTLILAPFVSSQIQRLTRSMNVRHESWLETKQLYDPEELGDRLKKDDIHSLVIEADFVFEETFAKASVLEFVAICRAATNHVDVQAATRRGIIVVNTPGRNALAVAELTVGMILSLARNLPQAHQYVRDGEWADPVTAYETLRGCELAGKVAGIIGLGTIGRLVARRLQAMEMTIIATDPYVTAAESKSLGIRLESLTELLKICDFVLVHTPATPETFGLIGSEEFNAMKPSGYLINTSAAGVVGQDAMIAALEQHRIAGAALDVFDGQPLPKSSKLLTLDNVLLFPHIGGATAETIHRHSTMVTDDLLAYDQGKRPTRLVNPEVWENRS